jgi:hypothetical protein
MVTKRDGGYAVATLKDIWESKGYNSTQVAGLARCSTPTLYKANRRGSINPQILFRICSVLGISKAEYDRLEPCPRRGEFADE